ncbi:DUF5602 domain-containing protein [bacterium]|nr:DUF5602 domain-containing protein [bacterium]
MYRFSLLLTGAALILVAFTACSDDDPASPAQPMTYDGQTVAVGDGSATAYERADADGNLLAVGIRFDEAALSNLPADMSMFTLDLPGDVSTSPFKFIALDWNPQGHEPAPIYTLPHFDVHFYCVDKQTVAAVVAGPDSTMPAPQYMPQDYFSTFDAVPNMGTHFIDSQSPELHGSTFDKTFIYGFYKGNLYFMEPMITKAYFESKPDVSLDIKQPTAFQQTGMAFPMKYDIRYDATAKQYIVELTDMSVR